ncbi:MAG: tetratricopeptide repeat protein [Nitrospira sp.]|nr:tetratricopeptide repeat protein [bacterium]MBL7048274.1 tetratricopeptide repeat protein [Nitrospira sp.]
MPKVIKRKLPKEKPMEAAEVQGAAMHSLGAIKKQQKNITIALAAVAVIGILFLIISMRSSANTEKAYKIETEAFDYYYSANTETLSEKDRLKKSAELFQQAIDVKASPIALYYLGNCFAGLDKHEDAIKAYELFLEKFSKETLLPFLVYQKMAQSYFRTGNNEKGLEMLAKLAKMDNGIFKDTALITEARHYSETNQPDKAMEAYKELALNYPASPWSVEASSRITAEETKTAAESKSEEIPAESAIEEKSAK